MESIARQYKRGLYEKLNTITPPTERLRPNAETSRIFISRILNNFASEKKHVLSEQSQNSLLRRRRGKNSANSMRRVKIRHHPVAAVFPTTYAFYKCTSQNRQAVRQTRNRAHGQADKQTDRQFCRGESFVHFSGARSDVAAIMASRDEFRATECLWLELITKTNVFLSCILIKSYLTYIMFLSN